MLSFTPQVQRRTAGLISPSQTLPHTLQWKIYTCHTDVKIIIKFIANVLNQVHSIVESIYFFLPFLTSRIWKENKSSSSSCYFFILPRSWMQQQCNPSTMHFKCSRTKGFTSTQCHDVLQPQPLGLLQMPCDVILGLVAACHVQDGLQAAIVDCSVGNNHGRSFLVRAWVPCRMPCHINEEWTTCSHAVKPVDFRGALPYQVSRLPSLCQGYLAHCWNAINKQRKLGWQQ